MQDLVKQKIIELVPSVLELKFGCMVGIIDSLPERVTSIRTVGRSEYVVTDVTREWWPKEKVQVIGSPITLPIVLQAIRRSEKAIGAGIYAIHCDGTFLSRSGDTGVEWDLTKDYDLQSQQTKDFLGSLLGVTNKV